MIGVYDYTVILTFLSLLSGCVGMIIAMSGLGHPYQGMFFILLSGLLDGLDGKVARTKKDRTKLEMDFGVQIDSFSDLVAFGVLPAAVGISLLRASTRFSDVPHWIEESGELCWYPIILVCIALVYILAAMIRLAYFNVTAEERKLDKETKGKEYFTGLPVTSAALVFPMVLLLHYIVDFDLSIVYFVVMLIMAILFIANFKIPKPGKRGLAVMIALGAAELAAFLITYVSVNR
jgi:CDP-diacylglycerol--serine O-phosphatidyltransferase